MNLLTLLNEGSAFDAEYGAGLSNHRPMALLALARLGADDARLQAFASTYARRLQPAPPAVPWPAGDAWAAYLGQRQAWAIYRDLFAQWLQHEDAGDVLRQTLPVLMQGCGAAAFHGLIRTAYAAQAGHVQELADALAYWACRWLDLGSVAEAEGRMADPEQVLRLLRVVRSDAGLIFQRMQAAARTAPFRAAVSQLQVGDGTLPRLAELAASAYAASGNFTALHLVTSAHALRVLWPCIEEPAAALRAYWLAYAAAVAAAGLQVAAPVALRPWPDIVARALASDDDHLIKLVDSCREQERALGGVVWQRAASRALAP
jgi:hypothetical protein